MSTPTTNFAFDKPTVGGDTNAWGGLLNTNWDDADTLFLALFSGNRAAAKSSDVKTGGIWSSNVTNTYFVFDGTDSIPFMLPNFTNNWTRFILDADADSYIEATADDSVDITIGATVIATLNTSGLLLVSDLFMTTGLIKDTSGNELLKLTSVASAVNYLDIRASATGNAIRLAALGGDTNIDIEYAAAGTGNHNATTGKWRENGVNISPIGKHTAWFPASAITPTVTAGAEVLVGEYPSNDVPYSVLAFDASVVEYAGFNVYMPKSWGGGTIDFVLLWEHPAAATFVVRWGVQAVCVGDSDPLDVAYGTAVEGNDTGGTTTDLFIATVITVTVASAAAEELLAVKIYRDAADAADTLEVDAKLVGVAMIYNTNAATDD